MEKNRNNKKERGYTFSKLMGETLHAEAKKFADVACDWSTYYKVLNLEILSRSWDYTGKGLYFMQKRQTTQTFSENMEPLYAAVKFFEMLEDWPEPDTVPLLKGFIAYLEAIWDKLSKENPDAIAA